MLGRKRAKTAEHEDRVVGHEEILAAAKTLLGSEGLIAITPERLSAAAGVPADRLDVDAVAAEAYRETAVAEIAEVRRTVLANPSPVEQMRALLSWLSTAPEDSDGVRLEAWALARHKPGLRSAVQESEAAWHGLVASVIRRGARSGEFPQADADDIAAHVISLVDGINAYQLIGYRSDFDRMRLLTRVVQAELGMIWGPKLADALS